MPPLPADTSDSEPASTDTLPTDAPVGTTDSGPTDTGTPGCPTSVWTSGSYALDHGGVQRAFSVYVPSSYDPTAPAPLVLVFHGWGGDSGEFLGDATVTGEADARGYVLIAPEGLGPEEAGNQPASWSFRGSTTGLDGDGLNAEVPGDSLDICDDARTTDYDYPSCAGVAENGCSWTHCQDDDVAFAKALVAEASQSLCIDAGRVYAVGGSNGGMFTWELGQNEVSAATFRAIAPLIGLPHRGYLAPPGRADGMPVLLITGAQDRTVPPGAWEDDAFTTTSDGDVYHYTGATAITRVWAEALGCDTAVDAASIDVGLPELDCRSYCDGGAAWPPLLDCRGEMGHTYGFSWSWPLIMDFFDRHP